MRKLFATIACISLILLFSVGISTALTSTYYTQPLDGIVELEIDRPDISLERIHFETRKDQGMFMLMITRIDSDRESGRVYDYFLINKSGLYSDPESIFFEIRINKSWVTENNIYLPTIALHVYNKYEKGWDRLETIELPDDADFFHHRVITPKLDGYFILTGQPVPLDFEVISPCNENDVCEPDLGEDRENCPDCIPKVSQGRCVPSEKYCIDDYIFECSGDGSEYGLVHCEFGCADSACLAGGAGLPTGMVVATNPVFLLVAVILTMVIMYLMFLVKRMRRQLHKIESEKFKYDTVKEIVTKK